MSLIAIRGGTVVDQLGRRQGDVVVDDAAGIVVDRPVADADRELDAGGCLVTPGFVDLHVHLRQPGNEAAETI